MSVPLGEVGLALDRYSRERLPAIGLAIFRELGEAVAIEEAGRIPVGTLKTSPHPGKAAASLRVGAGRRVMANLPDQIGYPRVGASDFEPALAQARLDTPLYYTDDARTDGAARGYFDILDAGRHTDSRGRQAGSLQAPDGISRPTIREVLGRGRAIVLRALAKVRGGR